MIYLLHNDNYSKQNKETNNPNRNMCRLIFALFNFYVTGLWAGLYYGLQENTSGKDRFFLIADT
jgi:hypothetical protein